MRYAQGVSEAATPTPTPATVDRNPPIPAGPADPTTQAEIEYADPVDPWAAAEAAAIAAGGQPGGYTPHPYPGATWTIPGAAVEPTAENEARTSRKRPTWLWAGGAVEPTAENEPRKSRKRLTWLWAGGAAVGVAAAVTAAAVIFWPGVSPIDFVPLREPKRVTPTVPVSSAFADAEVLGDRAYFASADETGTLRVVAADTAKGSKLWESAGAGQATLWKAMYALPDVVLLYSGLDSVTSTSRVVALDAGDGKRLWEQRLGSYDEIHFGSTIALWTNREAKRLVGIDLTDGKEKWSTEDPDSSAIHPVTTVKDLSGPAGASGRLFSPEASDDDRFVQVDADQTVTVRGFGDGAPTGSLAGAASTSDEIVAHDGRLYVKGSAAPQRILSYDLGDLGKNPVIVHTAPPSYSLSKLSPCGVRLCFVQTEGYDRTKDEVFAVGETSWAKPVGVPEVEALVPVGDAVLAVGDETTTLIDAEGRKGRPETGITVRLDAGNMLRFSDSLSSSVSDRTAWGIPLGESAVPLGEIADVRSASCSWNTSVIACAAEEDYVMYRFTD
ncbi:PQQ-binding-like beta-propeller repeat protein [Actinoplanes sp. NPDC049802]|uniref:outer membrane protein assembly factor BamB family protein n=1 Tax=Actinoplanes sp. NPDC049802 TaxID=3154742 RepID=UPI00340A45DB